MIARLLLIAVLVPGAAQTELDARAKALRADLAAASPVAQDDQRAFLQRQLLTSLERRRDLERARVDISDLARRLPVAAAEPAPTGLLELDDMRGELQQVEATLASDERRVELLQADRDAAAARFADTVEHLRQLEDEAGPSDTRTQVARLEAQLAESATAEIDAMLVVFQLQNVAERKRRDALAQRLSTATAQVAPTAADAELIQRRLNERVAKLQARLAAAADARDRAHQELQVRDPTTSPLHVEMLRERLANRDMDIGLAREALANVGYEQGAWQLALRYWREGDASAVIEARERGPAVRASLARRLEIMKATEDQVLGRIGTLKAQLAQAPNAADAVEWQALSAVFEERLQLLQAAMLDEHQLVSLLGRMRSDFNQRISTATWRERAAMALASSRALAARAWNQELFAVDQSVEIDGRQTVVARSVTVGKVVKAPLMLLLGVFLIMRITAWANGARDGAAWMRDALAWCGAGRWG